MEVGIVGLPYVGKTALFRALTGVAADPGGAARANVGVAPIPDPRLDSLARHVETKKIVPASLKVVDVPGLVRGASEGGGLGNAFLSHVRDVDALIHVVRCFESVSVPHVDGSLDAGRDIETVELELILADLQMVENALPRAEKSARKKEADSEARLSVLKKAEPLLSEGRPVRGLALESEDERRAMRGLAMLSAKPVLYVANVGEDDPKGEGAQSRRVREHAASHGAGFVPVCAQIEAELAELEPAERAEMLAGLGLEEPALHKLARAAYALLGLQSFYTAGPKEIRAWTIPAGSKAPQAAGAIHTDFERGFIRAEVYSVEDMEKYGSEKAIRDAGRQRTEGKEYVMRDGDVCHFLFNI
ncbi:MAG: redox-regulated ATPase YchF [Phycisphaeraceae bacterium]|nr:redox-regulated ATPase YchF [Phycisphaeraceae bacterium]